MTDEQHEAESKPDWPNGYLTLMSNDPVDAPVRVWRSRGEDELDVIVELKDGPLDWSIFEAPSVKLALDNGNWPRYPVIATMRREAGWSHPTRRRFRLARAWPSA